MQTEPHPVNPGSSSQQPDLGWSQARETITMLCLAMAQIEAALKDASVSVDNLADSFTKIASDSQHVLDIANKLEEEEGSNSHHIQLTASAKKLHDEIKSSIVSFQFHDRVSQKLSHVNRSLSLVADLISDTDRLFQPNEWQLIQNIISKSYTLECERLMFKKILEGATIKEALLLYEDNDINITPSSGLDDDGDVELF